MQKLRVSCFLWFGIKTNIFGKRHHRMSHCPFLLPSYSSFLTFASGLHFGDLPLLLLVQPLQLGGLEDPRVHLEHPHRRLSLRAQHHQGEERQEGGVPAPCRRLVFTDCGVCAQESGSRCSCYLGIPPSSSSSFSSSSSSFSYCCLTSSDGWTSDLAASFLSHCRTLFWTNGFTRKDTWSHWQKPQIMPLSQ